MTAIVPPRQIPEERRIMRRVKARRCFKWFVVFCLFASSAVIAQASLLGLAAMGAAVVAGIGAVVYRLIETPQEATVPKYFHARKEPPVVHLGRKG